VCGRYTLSTVDGPDLARRFDLIEPPAAETLGRANICPTEGIAVVTEPGRVETVPWGLRPFRGQSYTPINVRSETAGGRFKRLMDGGRVLVLADGWYEWLKAEAKGSPRIPFRYTVDGGVPFAFAGLYDGTGAAILTTTANAIAAPVHDRMPVVLPDAEAEAAWLSGEVDVPAALELLLPLEDARVSVLPANPAVNKAGVEGLDLLTAPLTQYSERLF
jgi:putative SOS response-associated peptidase YedK